MARLCWTALVLAVFLSAQSGEANKKELARPVEELARLVKKLLDVYKPTYRTYGDAPMFSLAISIPRAKNKQYNFQKVITADPPYIVNDTMNKCQVYTGTRVVAATLLKYPDFMKQCPNELVSWDYVKEKCPNVKKWSDFDKCSNKDITQLKKKVDGLVQHAEYRVLQNFDTLLTGINKDSKKTDLMLFYTFKSPCYGRCANSTNEFNILQKIANIKKWDNYAVVFSKIFEPNQIKPGTTEADLLRDRREALLNIGNVINGVDNIYRCIQAKNLRVQCHSCYLSGGNRDICLKNREAILIL